MDQAEPQLLHGLFSATHPRITQCQAPPTMAGERAYAAGSIDQVVREFLENTKLRFGESSSQVNTINTALSDFWSLKLSKKDAISVIILALGEQDDLRRDLMDVLYHKDARWGVGDFDFGQTPSQAIPQFLQPIHQPQLRLPPISPSWSMDYLSTQTVNPATLNDYCAPHRFGQQHRLDSHHTQYVKHPWPPYSQSPSSPMSQDSIYSPFSNHLSLPAPDLVSRHNVSTATGPTDMPHHNGSYSTPDNESTTEFHDPHIEFGYKFEMMDDTASVSQFCQLIQPVHESRPLRALAPKFAPGSPTLLETSDAMSTYPEVVPMPLPSKNCGHIASMMNTSVDGYQSYSRASLPEVRNSPGETKEQPRKKIDTKVSRERAEESCRFVHSLCGKAFSSRHGVKKHHWGAKNGDIHTTTGCWVKHKKPNVTWDAHPSCRAQPAVSNYPRKAGPMADKQESEHTTVPVLAGPAIHDGIPGFPTLEGLPQTVAEAVTPNMATQSISEDIGYLLNQNRPQVDFRTCITGATATSNIGMPTLEGYQHGHLGSCLDAHDAPAPRRGHDTSLWLNGVNEYHQDQMLDDEQADVDAMAMSYPSSLSPFNASPRDVTGGSQRASFPPDSS